MTAFTSSGLIYTPSSESVQADERLAALLKGEIVLTTQPHTAWGAAVKAYMYLPLSPAIVWQHVTDYPRWVNYFPALTHSEILSQIEPSVTKPEVERCKRVYQVASKNFIFFTAHVEIYLKVVESHQKILFCLESGSFNDFSAELKLQDYENGTLLSYFVQATPMIPVPSLFIQQAIQLDLPANMRNMRQEICTNLAGSRFTQ